ncbi:phage major capsid protein [Streptomyces sp. N2-109]|uniref:Phage major capsid protein n=1 Tax=Streptomyces gossypii TaxID=2883101 RepID=A0ABT2JV25_9ACTN|nr:phage major capsid protein [Streptomyces gossypii]MCT2591144.1 phage major capsid protein [Streptomyces gossypii]
MATPTIPRDSEQLGEILADKTRAKDILASTESLTKFIEDYANRAQGEGTDLQRLVSEETQRQFADFLRENGAEDVKRPDVRAKAPEADPYAGASKATRSQGLYNRNALGAKVDALFTDSGEYFNTIWRGNSNRQSSEVQSKLEQLKNFSSDVPSDGGFLIPETLRSELLKVALETALVRPRARVVPMETLRVPFPSIDSTTNVGSVYGGITGFWTEEGARLQESKPRFGRVVLDAKKLTAYTEVPSELLSDSIVSLSMFIDQMFPEALAFFEDQAFLNGSGVGEPLGVLNGAAAVSVARGTANTIAFTDVISMYARMLPQSMSRAVWVASIDSFPQLASMSFTPDGGTVPVSPMQWLNNGQLIGAPPMTLLGRPVVFTEKVPALGGAGDLSLVDFGFYLIGDRQAMQARQSDDFKFDTDEVAFRIIERIDGRPWLQSPITPANGGNSLSPIVKLGDAA